VDTLELDVAFVVMPFGGIRRPSIGVSLLQAALKKIGISSHIYYFNLKLAEIIGLALYDKISEKDYAGISLIGELIFSEFAFGIRCKREQIKEILSRVFDPKYDEWNDQMINFAIDEILNVRQYIPSFLEDCSSELIEKNPRVIGFTSTFHQNCASISLSRRIKKYHNTPIIFGGANCEGEMGYTLLKNTPCIDFICSGEGDIAFISFIQKYLLKKELEPRINGIITRASSDLDIALTSPVMDMNSLLYPDYDDYFASYEKSTLKNQFDPGLVIETSRGCWWGEKSHCTFCGLNGTTMKYRSKSAERVFDELQYLNYKYKRKKFQVVDNIMDLHYIQNLFPHIEKTGMDIELFYETKANISKSQLLVMKKGNVFSIQPGIESLSDHILQLMKKGVSALQNIQLLKWCKEMDITPYWNILWGFPGEKEIDYQKMAQVVPLLFHLCPPEGFGRIVVDRFSPYFIEPERHGLTNVKPSMAYNFVYPLDSQELKKIAYHFDYDYIDGTNPSTYVKSLRNAIISWNKSWNENNIPILNMYQSGDMMMIKDTRDCAYQGFYILFNESSKVYQICDSIHSMSTILTSMRK